MIALKRAECSPRGCVKTDRWIEKGGRGVSAGAGNELGNIGPSVHVTLVVVVVPRAKADKNTQHMHSPVMYGVPRPARPNSTVNAKACCFLSCRCIIEKWMEL